MGEWLPLAMAVGETIAVGAGMWAFLGLGLPWSLLLLYGPLPDRGDFADTAVYLTFALCNLLLHGLFASG
jgi:hypothetical protein